MTIGTPAETCSEDRLPHAHSPVPVTIRLASVPVNISGAVQALSDALIAFATTYGHWTPGEPPHIVSVRFTLAELDRMAGSR